MNEENTFGDIIKESKYNSGIDKIYTIGILRKGCHDFKMKKDFNSWYQCLRGWRSEINPRLDTKERDNCDSFHILFDSIFYKKGHGVTLQIGNKKVEVDLLSDLEIDNILYEYELLLGDLEQKYRMGMPDADDDEGL